MEQFVITLKDMIKALDFLKHKFLLPLEQCAFMNQYGIANICVGVYCLTMTPTSLSQPPHDLESNLHLKQVVLSYN